MKNQTDNKLKLGIFVVIGIALFIGAVYLLGSKSNLFGGTFPITAVFNNVGGLAPGNNVRFSGITVGTVKDIDIINDTSVMITMMVENEHKQFIKSDSKAAISADGLMGNKVINILPGSENGQEVKEGGMIGSQVPMDTEAIMKSLESTGKNVDIITRNLAELTSEIADNDGTKDVIASLKKTTKNAAELSGDLAKISGRITSGQGAMGKVLYDQQFSNKLDQTMNNVEAATDNLNKNMLALQSSFLFRKYFREKAEEKAQDAEIEADVKRAVDQEVPKEVEKEIEKQELEPSIEKTKKELRREKRMNK